MAPAKYHELMALSFKREAEAMDLRADAFAELDASDTLVTTYRDSALRCAAHADAYFRRHLDAAEREADVRTVPSISFAYGPTFVDCGQCGKPVLAHECDPGAEDGVAGA